MQIPVNQAHTLNPKSLYALIGAIPGNMLDAKDAQKHAARCSFIHGLQYQSYYMLTTRFCRLVGTL